MTEEQYNEKLKQIESDYNNAKKRLYNEYAQLNAAFKIGDIIADDISIIKVDKVGAYLSSHYSPPMIMYVGEALKKDLKPFKKSSVNTIYSNRNIKLIKGA